MTRTTDRRRAAFREFHAENPHVARLLLRFAMEARAAGIKRLSMRFIAERARWEARIASRGDRFALNNNHLPFYSRMLERENPDLAGFFTKRLSPSDQAELF